MKTLVIHPKDPTTDFLCKIYEGKNDWVVLRTEKECIPEIIIPDIHEADRVVMLGHGYGGGLFGHGKIIIDLPLGEELLNTKKECVSIWCNADQYVNMTGLCGFYTGMFISEPAEAEYCGVQATEQQIRESNDFFAKLVNEYIDHPNFYREVSSRYFLAGNKVAAYNKERLYYWPDLQLVDKKTA